MPKINAILEKNSKELDLSEFFSEQAFVTIKKLSPIVMRKIQIASIKKLSDKSNSEIFKKLSEFGENITDSQVIDVLSESDPGSQADMIKLEEELEKICIDNGLDEKKHNFTDCNDKNIKLNYKTLLQIGDQGLISCLVSEIRKFSKGKQLKK